MDVEGLAFVTAIDSIDTPEGDLIDIVELADGRIIAIDGERATLCESMDEVRGGISSLERPSLLL